MTDGELLRRAAERAAQRPFYLASALLVYACAERLDDAALAARLGCELASLPLLLLCRRPGEGSVFRADVEAIARRFALDAVRLARVIRAADALVSLGGAPPERTGGLLAAARDRAVDPSARRPKGLRSDGGRPGTDEPPDGPDGHRPGADRPSDEPDGTAP